MGKFQIHDDSTTEVPEVVARAQSEAREQVAPPTREESMAVIREMEALGLEKDDEWEAAVASHDDRTLMALIKHGTVDALTRMLEGDVEGFCISTYGVALLTVAAWDRGLF